MLRRFDEIIHIKSLCAQPISQSKMMPMKSFDNLWKH